MPLALTHDDATNGRARRAEMRACADAIAPYAAASRGWIVLMLHSTLAAAEQDRAFAAAPDGARKVVLATHLSTDDVSWKDLAS